MLFLSKMILYLLLKLQSTQTLLKVMVTRDGYQSNLPHKSLSNHKINTAIIRDQKKKTDTGKVYSSYIPIDKTLFFSDC